MKPQIFARIGFMLLLAGLLTGCIEPIFFHNSQPNFAQEESKFDAHLLGTFFNVEDSSTIIISNQGIRHNAYWFGDDERDTLFRISEKHILKKYKKKYFLNYQDFDGHWFVHIFKRQGDVLTFYCLSVPEGKSELEALANVVEIRNDCGDVVKVVLSPTRKGLKELIADENLIELGTFIKVDDSAIIQ